MKNKTIRMPFGKYKGVAVKTIPNSYLRWLITANVPDFIKQEARLKLQQSDFDNTDIEITRHALDMFSKRFLEKWTDRNIGLGTFVAHLAIEALSKGKMFKDDRHLGKGVKIYFDGVVYVFSWAEEYPEYKSLITVMPTRKLPLENS